MNPRALLTSWVVLAALCGPLFGEEEVDLRWGLEKGKKYKYKISTRSEVSFNIPMRGEAKTVVMLETVADLKTGSLKTGKVVKASMSGKYSHVIFHLEIPEQGSAHFDSSSDMDRRDATRDPVKRGLLTLAGKVPFGFKMSETGGVSKMSGHNRFVPRAFPVRGGKEAIPMASNLVLNQLLRDKSVEETFNDLFIPFPGEKSLPGDSWKGESKGVLYPLGTYIFKSTYTLKEVKEGKSAVITCTSEVERDPRSEPGFGIPAKDQPGGGWIKIEDLLKKFKVVESKREGEFVFDLEKMEMKKGKVELTLQLEGSFDNPLSGEAINIPLKATHKRTLERIEEE